MGNVVRMADWRRGRGADPAVEVEASVPKGPRAHPSLGGTRREATGQGVERLDRAVRRLHELVNRTLERAGHVQPHVETELLAIMGELTLDLVEEAAARAERLAERLAGKG